MVATLREAVRLHDKPQQVSTDRDAAFTAWRDVTYCEQDRDERRIDHSLRKAHQLQGGGQIESVIGTVQREITAGALGDRPLMPPTGSTAGGAR